MEKRAHQITPLTHPLDAVVEVPGSKSHTNRALVCAALAAGRSRLEGVLFADDTWAMLSALETLGLDMAIDEGSAVVEIVGCDGQLPANGDQDTPRVIDVRQSGTTGRFLLPVLALGSGRYILDGDEQLRARPFDELVEALRDLGAGIEGDSLPLMVDRWTMKGGHVQLSGSVSSQYLSGILLSAPCAESEVVIELTSDLVSKPYIDLTLNTMSEFGASVINNNYRKFVVANTGYTAANMMIEPDASAASYFFAAAAVTGGTVTVNGLGSDTVQGDLDFVDILGDMGATVEKTETSTKVTGPKQLTGVTVDMANVSDTAQTLAVVASFASGPTKVTGIGFIRKKETDRVGAVVTELTRLGIEAVEDDDGFTIFPGVPQAGTVKTYDDHRMAMSFSVLGLVHPGIAIANPGCVSKTFPTFFDVLNRMSEPDGPISG